MLCRYHRVIVYLELGGTSNPLAMSIDMTRLPRVSSSLTGNISKDGVMGILP